MEWKENEVRWRAWEAVSGEEKDTEDKTRIRRRMKGIRRGGGV